MDANVGLEHQRHDPTLEMCAELLRNAPVGISLWHLVNRDDRASFRLVYSNPASSRVSGIDLEASVGRKIGDLYPMLLQTDFPDKMRNVVLSEQPADLGERKGSYSDRFIRFTAFPVPGDLLGLIGEDITERKAAEDEAHAIVYEDRLTGLPTRLHLGDRLEAVLHQARVKNWPVAVLLLDLDEFKFVNDALGHAAGDRFLVLLADRLKGCLREDDVLARTGGDEFVFAITGHDAVAKSATLAERIQRAIKDRPFFVNGREVYSTASIGIATFPVDGDDAEALVKNADIAMFHAKQLGRDRVCLFEAALGAGSGQRFDMESELRRALVNDELTLHYQPIVETATRDIVGCEALLRWNHPKRGFLAASEFIWLAETTRLIVPIGEWVMREACAMLQTIRTRGFEELRMAINVSAAQFDQPDLAEQVADTVDEFGLGPGAIELEITETTAMRDAARAASVLETLRRRGVLVSIDDFGIGQSSLRYLQRFPLSTLKIDRAFVQNLAGDANDEAIVRMVNALARSLNLKVVAEGVETEEQAAMLWRIGCTEMQGYLFGKPVSRDEFLTLLE